MRDHILEKACQKRGAVKEIAEKCGISPAAVSQWNRVPKKHLAAVAEVTGIAAPEFRPELFGGTEEQAA